MKYEIKEQIMYKKERFVKEITIETFLEQYFDGERILQKCRECPGFAKTWSCPEFNFAPEDYWKRFSIYQVICDRISMDGAESPQEAQQRLLYKEKPVFNREILGLEHTVPGSRALYAERCDECKICARIAGKPCRFPEIMRYSVESLGGSAVDLVSDLFGFDVLWSDGKTIPDYYILLGGLLKV